MKFASEDPTAGASYPGTGPWRECGLSFTTYTYLAFLSAHFTENTTCLHYRHHLSKEKSYLFIVRNIRMHCTSRMGTFGYYKKWQILIRRIPE
jgi:hypothetical protein